MLSNADKTLSRFMLAFLFVCCCCFFICLFCWQLTWFFCTLILAFCCVTLQSQFFPFWIFSILSAGAAHQQELLPAQKCTGSIQRIRESIRQPQGEASVWCGEAGSQSSGQVLRLLCATLRWPQYPFFLLFSLQKLVIFHGRLQVFMNIGNEKLGLKFSCKVKEQQAIKHACTL